MKFGKSWDEAQQESTGGSGYLKYFKNDETTFRVLQEPSEWVAYWEHFNPGGFPFPCTQDRNTCPGCTSKNEKMKKANRRVAFNVLEGEYVNAYKVPKTVADKLANRAERSPSGTVTDRDYTIYKIKSKNADGSTKVDYDVEGQDRVPVDVNALRDQFADIEELLQEAFNESWGDSDKAAQTRAKNEETEGEDDLRSKLKSAHEREWKDSDADDMPPWAKGEDSTPDTAEYDEADLRKMDKAGILAVCDKEGLQVPSDVQQLEVDGIVDWLLEQ
jgi:hypothetical protein